MSTPNRSLSFPKDVRYVCSHYPTVLKRDKREKREKKRKERNIEINK
jgi:hypothetical protein